MINLLTREEQARITKKAVIRCEESILFLLGFDLIFVSPLSFLERYLRLANLHLEKELGEKAKSLCIFARVKPQMLKYKPSLIAGACLFIAMAYIYEINESNCNEFLTIWNTSVVAHTGYTLKDFDGCYTELCEILGIKQF